MRVLAVDPGTRKTGVAVLDADGSVLHRSIEPTPSLALTAVRLHAAFACTHIALGKGTNTAAAAQDLQALQIPIQLVDERETTLHARRLYFQEYPPAGWRRLIPIGMQMPPRPIDDYAAVLIGRRFLAEGAGREAS